MKRHIRPLRSAATAVWVLCLFGSATTASRAAAQETDHIVGVAHIGLAVQDIEKTVADLTRALALPRITIEDVKARQTKVAIVDLDGVELEVMQNYSGDAAAAKTLKERGDYISHVCLKTKDIVADIAILKRRGVEFRDEKPRASDFTKKWIAYTKTGAIGGLAFELLQPYPEPPTAK